jgi:hypothetical protein
MTSSRREFLKRGSWLTLAAGVPLGLAENALGMGVTRSSAAAGLSKAAFESQLHTKFVINEGASKVTLMLVNVANFASRNETKAGKEGFSLVFRGPKNTALQQNTYLFEHEKLGMFSFLLVPIGTKDQRAAHYEAVINRLNP